MIDITIERYAIMNNDKVWVKRHGFINPKRLGTGEITTFSTITRAKRTYDEIKAKHPNKDLKIVKLRQKYQETAYTPYDERKRRYPYNLMSDVLTENIEPSIITDNELSYFMKCINGLKPAQKTIISMHYDKHLPYITIGERLNISKQAANAKAQQALVKLRQSMRLYRFTQGIPNESEDKINRLGLSVRAYNCLMRAGISTKTQLKSMTEEDVKAIKMCGEKVSNEILDIINILNK